MIGIQARSTSKRFPGKCLAKIDGVPMLGRVYQRCDVVFGQLPCVLIPYGDELGRWCNAYNIPYYEGNETDLIDRYLSFLKANYNSKGIGNYVVRITGDCPLVPLSEIELVFKNYWFDFVSNCISPQVDGWEVELLSMKALEWLNKNAKSKHDKEHVTTYLKRNLRKFEEDGLSYKSLPSYSLTKWIPKLSIDTPDDLKRVERIYKQLCKQNKL